MPALPLFSMAAFDNLDEVLSSNSLVIEGLWPNLGLLLLRANDFLLGPTTEGGPIMVCDSFPETFSGLDLSLELEVDFGIFGLRFAEDLELPIVFSGLFLRKFTNLVGV